MAKAARQSSQGVRSKERDPVLSPAVRFRGGAIRDRNAGVDSEVLSPRPSSRVSTVDQGDRVGAEQGVDPSGDLVMGSAARTGDSFG